MSTKALIAYIPVLHQGYLNLFAKIGPDLDILIVGKTITSDYRSFQKDLRAIEPNVLLKAIESLGVCQNVYVLEKDMLQRLDSYKQIYMPEDELSRALVTQLSLQQVTFVNYFLRWDSDNAKAHQDVAYDREESLDDFRKDILNQIVHDANQSSDLYRQVGGAVFRQGVFCLKSFNHAVPSLHTPFYEGDPRGQFNKGVNVDLSLFLHAEASLISEAARKGISLEGAEMIVTDFPCPPCAKLVAYSGIKKLFYLKGYAMLDGERILKDQGVEIIKISSIQP